MVSSLPRAVSVWSLGLLLAFVLLAAGCTSAGQEPPQGQGPSASQGPPEDHGPPEGQGPPGRAPRKIKVTGPRKGRGLRRVRGVAGTISACFRWVLICPRVRNAPHESSMTSTISRNHGRRTLRPTSSLLTGW